MKMELVAEICSNFLLFVLFNPFLEYIFLWSTPGVKNRPFFEFSTPPMPFRVEHYFLNIIFP